MKSFLFNKIIISGVVVLITVGGGVVIYTKISKTNYSNNADISATLPKEVVNAIVPPTNPNKLGSPDEIKNEVAHLAVPKAEIKPIIKKQDNAINMPLQESKPPTIAEVALSYTQIQFNALELEIDLMLKGQQYIEQQEFDKLTTRLNAFSTLSIAGTDIENARTKLELLRPFIFDSATTTEIAVSLTSPVTEEQPISEVITAQVTEPKNCISNPDPLFITHISDLQRIKFVTPPGTLMPDGDIKTHAFIWNSSDVKVPVYAPVDMTLTSGAYYLENNLKQYILHFDVSCEVTIKYDHITAPIANIVASFSTTTKSNTTSDVVESPIFFGAGSLIGFTVGNNNSHNWDFGVYNSSKPNFLEDDPDFNWSTMYTTADCPFKYFNLQKEAEYATKYLNTSLIQFPLCN